MGRMPLAKLREADCGVLATPIGAFRQLQGETPAVMVPHTVQVESRIINPSPAAKPMLAPD